ncbi:MAG: hypothetical protein K2Y51_06120 [Gammaproteobacteria bacterium]|nr:hypothetical protein [Gammaproteobacteria bacterium]
MLFNSILAALGALCFVVALVLLARQSSGGRALWQAPLALSCLFLVYSVWTIGLEGPVGFWPVHTQSFWGTQVWLDLLLSIGIGWALVLPRARAVGMHAGLWLVAIVMSGSVALLAMVARLWFLESRGAAAPIRA